ncbi:MAG: adenylate cyclase [Ignavibacteria bacterium]|nr:MAG: adenylate cyclase [Ignavibacteria bacterium]KAF0161179.1 MAG: adenylate cyclase [Ignavibacteria bacterium]
MIKYKIKWNRFVLPVSVFLSVLAFSAVLTQEWLFTITPVKELELKLIDDRFRQRGEVNISDSSKVIILEISQETYEQIPAPYNKWPLPRSVFAAVIENLTEAGVKAIGLDIVMSSADKFSVLNDSMLINAIRKSGKVVVAGKVDESQEQKKLARQTNIDKINEHFQNIFFFADSSIGIVNTPSDYDGVYRRYIPYAWVTTVNKLIPSFGYAVLNKYYNLTNDFTAQRMEDVFVFQNKIIPQFDRYSSLVNFYGASGTFKRVPLIDVLDDKDFDTVDEVDGVELNIWDSAGGILESGKLKDKIVLIGSTMPEDRDLLNVSFSKGDKAGDNQMYGVEFHANAIQNVISNDFLEKQSRTAEIIFLILFTGFIFAATSLLRKLKLRYGTLIEILNLLLTLFLIYSVYRLSIYYFINHNIITSVVNPAIGIVFGYFGSTAFHFLKERKQNILIKGMFSQYVNKQVVQELLNNPDKLKLGGEKKNVTILFSDMAGFTTFAESKSPEELVKFINGLLHEMTELIMHNTGTLDKYLGDAVMAFWGAPLELKDHAYRACKTAVEMQKKVEQISREWIEKGEKPLHIRIGLNTGNVIVGNVGGEKHKNYTVMGDCVNLASRLEGANKEYGTQIMISEFTYEAAKEFALVRELDSIKVKGKSKPAKVYELIGMAGDSDAELKLSSLHEYNSALKLYKQKKFAEASVLFEYCFSKNNDYTSKVYLDRCKSYIENPPEENWDGVFIIKAK